MHEANERGYSRPGILAIALLTGVSAAAAAAQLWKLLAISWIACLAMGVAAYFGARSAETKDAQTLVWGYGLASGAMIVSASVFLVPVAIQYDASYGGFGIGGGILFGFSLHTVSHWLTHQGIPIDSVTTELTIHALAAGTIIGAVYSLMPQLGALLGLAIISHKAPAGYAAGRRLAYRGLSTTNLLLPAAAVGLMSLPVGLLGLDVNSWIKGTVFGFASGVFLHVALDFLPRCEIGGEIYNVADLSDVQHGMLDRLRFHAIASTFVGGFFVFGAWLFIH